jgi:hypothetical protein
VQRNPRQLLVSLSTRTRMKCRDRPKSVGDFSLLYAIQSLADLGNINHDLFFTRE